eukprot:scaffold64546_cov66-Phaeocystis_antarctica.AAC.1
MERFLEQFVDVFTNERAGIEPFVAALPFVAGRALFTSALLLQLNSQAHTHAYDLGLRLHLWAPSALVTAGDACLGAGLVLGSVAPLPVVMAVGAAMDLLAHSHSAWAPERRLVRTVPGCLLAAAALVLAIWCAPDARAWPADSEQLGLAMGSGPVIMLLLALVMILAFASLLQRAVGRVSAPRLISLALQAAALGTIGLLAVASLASILRHAFSDEAEAEAFSLDAALAALAASRAAGTGTTAAAAGTAGEGDGGLSLAGLVRAVNASRRLQAARPLGADDSGLGLDDPGLGLDDPSLGEGLGEATDVDAASPYLDVASPFQSTLPLQLAAAAAAALALQALSLRAALRHERLAEGHGTGTRLGATYSALLLLCSAAAVCI